MAHAVGDVIGAVVGGIVGGVVGFVGSGFNPVGAVVGAVEGGIQGVTAAEGIQSAQDKANEVKHDTTTTTTTSSTSTSTSTSAGGGASTNSKPGPDGTPTALAPDDPKAKTPTQLDLANEQWAQYNLQMSQMKEQIGTQVLGMKAQELSAESSMRASTALRGLKLEGSPAVQLYAQAQAGAQAIKYAEDTGAASLAGDEEAQALAADKFRWSAAQQLQQADTAVSDAWVNALSAGLNTASGIMSQKFPTSLFPASNPYNPQTGGPLDTPGQAYYGY